MTRPVVISSLSKEYVRVPVRALEAGVAVDPTSSTVDIACITSGEPIAGDWKAAAWETDATTTPPTYFARLVVGPGSALVLADGRYTIWVRVNGTPEIPVKPAGTLVVT